MNFIRIGISGWTYPPWRGVFFPKGWPQERELEYASRQINSIEINGTFYSLQRPASCRAWAKGGTPSRTHRIGPPAPPAKRGRDVFVCFDNDVKVRAPFDAMTLAHRLRLGPAPCAASPTQRSRLV